MPFFEVYDFNAPPGVRADATRRMTAALCDAYGIEPDIVSAYFVDVGRESYGHCGLFGEKTQENRIFIKLHAFPRPDEARRAAARAITEAVARAYDMPSKLVAIYFFDRDSSQISHNGVLASD